MAKKRTIKKELSLVEGLIVDSKELINVKNVIAMARELLFRISKGRYRPIDSRQDNLKSMIFEYENRRNELEVHMANMIKVAYSHQYEIKFDKFHLSTGEMQVGHCMLTVHKHKEVKKAVLFLTDTPSSSFGEVIKAGEIREYTEELERDYLSNCPPAWTPNSFSDLHFERLKSIIK